MCTAVRFTDKDNNLYAGRNLDWECGYGEHPVVVPMGWERPYLYCENTTAKAGAIIGMGIVAEGLPLLFDCGNESGVYVAGLNFPGYAQFEDPSAAPIDGKINVAAYEFPLWVASEFKSVAECKEALKDVAIIAKPPTDYFPVSLLHWFICDKDQTIVVEYMADGIHIYDNDLDVLTNQPTYPYHRENVRSYLNVDPYGPKSAHWGEAELTPYGAGAGMRGLPGDYYSPSRFIRAAYTNSFYPQQDGEEANVTRLLRTLGSVFMVKGCSIMANGNAEFTVFSDCFSVKTGTIYLTQYDHPEIVSLSLKDVPEEILNGTEVKMYDKLGND